MTGEPLDSPLTRGSFDDIEVGLGAIGHGGGFGGSGS
jgi:hypothetical protein